jgi:hypothetical protein
MGKICPFHTDEWVQGSRQSEGFTHYRCDRSRGHPGDGPWEWLEAPEPPGLPELAGLGEELSLAVELPAALKALGEGWFEYGLVEREYAYRRPRDFAVMVRRWGHTALGPKRYTVSSYIAGTLGRLSGQGVVAYHSGEGTGRWRQYNSDISWWSALSPGPWESRTSWRDRIGDGSGNADEADACLDYVPADLR